MTAAAAGGAAGSGAGSGAGGVSGCGGGSAAGGAWGSASGGASAAGASDGASAAGASGAGSVGRRSPAAGASAAGSAAALWRRAPGADSLSSPGSAMTTSGVPTLTVVPSSTRISLITPAAGDGTSVSTLSVEISSRTSSSAIVSPTCLAHEKIVPSVTVSPSCGMLTVTATAQLLLRVNGVDVRRR